MNQPQTVTDELPRVRSSMNYLAPMDEAPIFYTQEYWKSNLVFESRELNIADYREHRSATNLKTTGFELFDHDPGVLDLNNVDQIRTQLLSETQKFLAQHFGAPKIVMIQPVFRWSEREPHPEMENSRPARFIHTDLSRKSFYDFAREHISTDPDVDYWMSGRVAVFNTWRALSQPPQDCPLALLDRRTLEKKDVVEGTAVIDAAENPFSFTTTLVRYNPAHNWGYFSNMTAKELLVFLNYDSEDDSLPGSPHCAFDDPSYPPGVAIPRSSFEVRGFMYWGKPAR